MLLLGLLVSRMAKLCFDIVSMARGTRKKAVVVAITMFVLAGMVSSSSLPPKAT